MAAGGIWPAAGSLTAFPYCRAFFLPGTKVLDGLVEPQVPEMQSRSKQVLQLLPNATEPGVRLHTLTHKTSQPEPLLSPVPVSESRNQLPQSQPHVHVLASRAVSPWQGWESSKPLGRFSAPFFTSTNVSASEGLILWPQWGGSPGPQGSSQSRVLLLASQTLCLAIVQRLTAQIQPCLTKLGVKTGQ